MSSIMIFSYSYFPHKANVSNNQGKIGNLQQQQKMFQGKMFHFLLLKNTILHNFNVMFHQEDKYSNYLLKKSWNTPKFYFLA